MARDLHGTRRSPCLPWHKSISTLPIPAKMHAEKLFLAHLCLSIAKDVRRLRLAPFALNTSAAA